MAVKKISKVQPEKFEFSKKTKKLLIVLLKIILLENNKVQLWLFYILLKNKIIIGYH